jgi:response regulator RpfG family c-di-GMP phosphodiesterase
MPNTHPPHSSVEPAAAKSRGMIVVVDASPLSLIATAGVLDSQGYSCVCARTLDQAISAMGMGPVDLIVCDVGNDAAAALETLMAIRANDAHVDLPAVLIADTKWAGLEKKTEAMGAVTRCLFKPIDPGSLLAVVDQLMVMPHIVASHRRRGTRPGRPGWVSL